MTENDKQINNDLCAMMKKHKLDHFKHEFMQLGLFEPSDLLLIENEQTLESVGFRRIQKRAFQNMKSEHVDARLNEAEVEMNRMKSITITVHLPDNDVVEIIASTDDKISHLKMLIAKKRPEHPVAFQKLLDSGNLERPLVDSRTIRDTLPPKTATIRLTRLSWSSTPISSATNPRPWPTLQQLREFGVEIISAIDPEDPEILPRTSSTASDMSGSSLSSQASSNLSDAPKKLDEQSVGKVLDALEEGKRRCEAGLAVVFSQRQGRYYLLFTKDKMQEKIDIMHEAKRRYRVEMSPSQGEDTGREEKRHVEYDLHYGLPHRKQYRIHPKHDSSPPQPPFEEGIEIQGRARDDAGFGWLPWRSVYTIKAAIHDSTVFGARTDRKGK